MLKNFYHPNENSKQIIAALITMYALEVFQQLNKYFNSQGFCISVSILNLEETGKITN